MRNPKNRWPVAATLAACVTLLPAGCAHKPIEAKERLTVSALNGQPNTLRGKLESASCPTKAPYAGTFAVLQLQAPLQLAPFGKVDRVELVLDEADFVRYGQIEGRNTSVTCRIEVSHLCGFEQAMCAPGTLDVEP